MSEPDVSDLLTVDQAIAVIDAAVVKPRAIDVALADADRLVLAEDIVPEVRDELSDRIQRERLDNVAVKLGTTDNPMLPAASFDRVFMVHMYHEVTAPYAFLWHLREGVKPNGLVVVVDSNRPVRQHGMPPPQLKCELGALGLEPVKYHELSGGDVYLMSFRLAGPRPAPDKIKPCKS